MLWLVLPILLAIVAYYILSPLVAMGHGPGADPVPAPVFIVTALLCVLILALEA